MRKAVLVLSIVSCALTGADARGRHHHGHHFDMYLQAMPGAETPSTQRQSRRRSGRERLAVVAPTDHLPAERSIDTAQIVPRDWNLESPDPNRNGERFVSPDGTAWFEWYRVAAGDKSVAAHKLTVKNSPKYAVSATGLRFPASAAIGSSIAKPCSPVPETAGITSPLNTQATPKGA